MGLYLGKEKISNVASVITQNADSMATEIQNHIADTNIHITADERTKWNAAADNTEDFASTGVMNTNINMNNNSIKNLATPIENNDAVNKGYVDSKALPTTSASDNGKVLSVVNGAWAAAAMSSGAYIGSYAGDGTSDKKILTFDFKPAIIFIIGINTSSSNGESFEARSINGQQAMTCYYNSGTTVQGGSGGLAAFFSDNTITIEGMYAVGATDKVITFNKAGILYIYAVIPAMN